MVSTRHALLAARCWLVLAWAVAGAVVQAQGVSIRLAPQAELRGARYTLGELAEVRSTDTALAQALAATPIGLAPRIGYAQAVARRSVVLQVERHHPGLRGQLQWAGADTVQVRATGERPDAAALQQLAERTLVDALAQRGLQAAVQATGRLDGLRLPAGALQASARLAEGWVPARQMRVWVDLVLDGQPYRSLPLAFHVRARQLSWVVQQALPAGAPLQPQDVAEAWVDVTTLAAPPLAAGTVLAGLRLRRAVQAGAPLVAAAVEPRPAVQRNQPVEVQVALGAVQLQTSGVALRDARLGETVKVRNTASNGQFAALVIADGRVRVEAR